MNFDITTINNDSLTKFTIKAYTDPKCSGDPIETFDALINPAQFTEETNISYIQCQAPGTSGVQLQFDKIVPSDFTLDLILDATGLLEDKTPVADFTSLITSLSLRPKPESIKSQVERLKKVMHYDGDIHGVYYLELKWGNLSFKCNITKLSITYTVFRPSGVPLRAKVQATFKQFQEDELREKTDSNHSPDLTHVRTVKAGDTLPLMTHRIYGDFSYYLEVARVNKLKNYRDLTPGMKLIFPPFNKETA